MVQQKYLLFQDYFINSRERKKGIHCSGTHNVMNSNYSNTSTAETSMLSKVSIILQAYQKIPRSILADRCIASEQSNPPFTLLPHYIRNVPLLFLGISWMRLCIFNYVLINNFFSRFVWETDQTMHETHNILEFKMHIFNKINSNSKLFVYFSIPRAL